jgi:hypothetical protein
MSISKNFNVIISDIQAAIVLYLDAFGGIKWIIK